MVRMDAVRNDFDVETANCGRHYVYLFNTLHIRYVYSPMIIETGASNLRIVPCFVRYIVQTSIFTRAHVCNFTGWLTNEKCNNIKASLRAFIPLCSPPTRIQISLTH